MIDGQPMVSAWVVEVFADDTQVARGLYGFVQLPSMGDRLTFPNDTGKLDVLGVIQIAHSPGRVHPVGPRRSLWRPYIFSGLQRRT